MLADEIEQVVRDEADIAVDIPRDRDLYNEVGVSSVDAIKILMALEVRYGVTFDDRQFAQSRTVNALTELVRKLLES
jgi:acyl carrier protein